LLITDPIHAWSTATVNFDPLALQTRATDDGLPAGFIPKVTGVALVLLCVCSLGMGCKYHILLEIEGTDHSAVCMRVIKDRASTSQIMVVVSFCPAVVSAL